ncbi:unnamed protein product [Adineta ricciae]|uniref:ADP ribosyltransferase domain-containing protein n=1 Tax=Adineta ricciae TaxID=249248 RepID=A0A813ZZ54_ADIRI|nr:unnamed protein product [Adineta ricciae]CAF1078263.1 unnamed protein product [Adineta ricciae]
MGNRSTSKNKSSIGNPTTPLEDLNIVWLNTFTHEDSDRTFKLLPNLQQILPSIRTFNNVTHCEVFLRNEVHNNQIVFLIVSDTFAEDFLPHIRDLSYINSIYILGRSDAKSGEKIFSDISELCRQLKEDVRDCQNDLTPIHLLNNIQRDNKLEPSFMYSRLLKETLINIEYDENAKKDFVEYCRMQFNQLPVLDDFERDYEKHSPIWWYTRDCFVYEMLNKALRTGDIDILIKMAFFIRDLHQQIQSLYVSQDHYSMTVYRGQGTSISQFESLCQCKGGLISFPNFLSTSLDKEVSLDFARRAIMKPGLRGILFRMKIDRKYSDSSNPYGSINKLSYFKGQEKEILFSTHTVFRLEDVRPMKDEPKIWQIDLKLTTNEDDVQLEQLTKHFREDLQSTTNQWENLAKLLLTMGEYDKAQQIYENLLEKTFEDDYEQLAFLYHQLGCVYNEKKNFEQALNYFQESLYLKRIYSPGQLADTYSNIGSIFHRLGKLDDALQYFQYALETNTNNEGILASLYNNIGMVLKKQGEYVDAIKHLEKSLQIDLSRLPSTHPDLAITYSNIGRVYINLKDYYHAAKYFQKTVNIRRLSLPQNHPSLLIAIANYENTLALLPENNLQTTSSAPVQSTPFKHSHRLNRTLSSYAKMLKRKPKC